MFHLKYEIKRFENEIKNCFILQFFRLTKEGEYYCIVHQKGYKTICSKPVNLILAPESPIILKQPKSHEICLLGSKVTLYVEAVGHPSLSYQWFKGNHQLDGCCNPSLTVGILTIILNELWFFFV